MRRLFLPLALALAVALPLAARAAVTSASGRLRFVPGPGAISLAENLAATGDADRDFVARDVGRDWDGVTEVRVALDAPSFRALLPKGARVTKWAQGVAFPELNLVVVRGFPGDPEARSTLRHELSHVAVGRLTHGAVPRWFLEGLAMLREEQPWTSEGPSLIGAALTGHLLPFSALTRGFPEGASDAELAYAESGDFVTFLVGRSGESALRAVLADVVKGARFDAAIRAHLGEPLPQLERQWRSSLARWELVVHLITSSELWWLVLAFIVIYAGWRLRRRRRRAFDRMDAEETAEQLRLFSAEPAYWADASPSPGASAADEDAPDDDADELEEEDEDDELDARLDALAAARLDDEDGEDDEDGDRSTPKKPTLH